MSKIVKIFTESQNEKVINFLHLSSEVFFVNFSNKNIYSMIEVRSRIYYFKEIFFYIVNQDSNIIAFETIILPENIYDTTAKIGIIKANEKEVLINLHNAISNSLIKNNISKIKFDVLGNDNNKIKILLDLGLEKEAVLKNELFGSNDLFMY